LKPSDRDLGMDRRISRRDLLHGLGLLTTGTLAPGLVHAIEASVPASRPPQTYPPARTGLRGSHPGSFEVAHAMAHEGRSDWGPVAEPDAALYDLVVVGAGISGLAAAHFFLQRHPDARVLILDNHDDFGGHAKRNEFIVAGRRLIGYGGSQTLEEPSSYPAAAKSLLRDLGVELTRFETAYDRGFFRRNGLAGAVFFNRAQWGADRLVPLDLGGLGYTLPLAAQPLSVPEAVQAMPMSAKSRREMLRLLTDRQDRLQGMSVEDREELLGSISYREFLVTHVGIRQPEVLAALQDLGTDLGGGIEAVSAYDALTYIGLPGFEASGLPDEGDGEPYIHHFPDGNASIARLLVRRMIPAAAPGSTMEDIVLTDLDYAKLDVEGSSARLRLNSTVVRVAHEGDAPSARAVNVVFVRNGSAARVRGRFCVLACYNAAIPWLCPELPREQREALSAGAKVPVQYTNVALRSWRAWKALKVGAISAPGSYHVNAMLDFPVNLGGYEFAVGPDDPVIVHMERFPHRSGPDVSKRRQLALGRHEMLAASFETIERATREQLAAMLDGGGFDPAREIAGITVNRWPHGYASRDSLVDPYYEDADDERYWFVRGRQPHGRIAIANSDAGASADVETAISQAHRAIAELG
jgi:spermidine dehydrogenase